MKFNKILLTGLIAALVGVGLAAPRATLAESSGCVTAGCTTTARVDFEVIIPRFVRLQIGSLGLGTIDNVSFQPTGAVVGDGFAVSATSGGDISPGVLTASVLSNGGNVTLVTTLTDSGSGLNDGAGNFIAWDEIDTVDGGTMTAPTLQNGGVTNEVYTATLNIVNLTDTWTYTSANTTVPVDGTYTGRATYTAGIP